MRFVDNDRWAGSLPLARNARHRYTVEAWRDEFGTWRAGLAKKVEARCRRPGGAGGGAAAAPRGPRPRAPARAAADAARIDRALAAADAEPTRRPPPPRLEAEDLLAVMRRHPDRATQPATRSSSQLVVDRELARHGAWYELFPRSQGARSGGPDADDAPGRDLAA